VVDLDAPNVFIWRIPRYSARQLGRLFCPGLPLADARIRALQAGFARAEHGFTVRAATILYTGLLKMLEPVVTCMLQGIDPRDLTNPQPSMLQRVQAMPKRQMQAIMEEVNASIEAMRAVIVRQNYEDLDALEACENAWPDVVLEAYVADLQPPGPLPLLPLNFVNTLIHRARQALPALNGLEGHPLALALRSAVPQFIQDTLGFQPVAQKFKFIGPNGGEYIQQLQEWATANERQAQLLCARIDDAAVRAGERDAVAHYNCTDRVHIVQRIATKHKNQRALTFPKYFTKKPNPIDKSTQWTLPRFKIKHEGREGERGVGDNAVNAIENMFKHKKHSAQNEAFIQLFFNETQQMHDWLLEQTQSVRDVFNACLQQQVQQIPDNINAQLSAIKSMFEIWTTAHLQTLPPPIDDDY
jgi:hypothetical protein